MPTKANPIENEGLKTWQKCGPGLGPLEQERNQTEVFLTSPVHYTPQ